MPELHVFEYAVIRVVPRVEREEFLNVGVVLYCKQQAFLGTKTVVDAQRLCAFSKETSLFELQTYLAAFEQISQGVARESPISSLDKAARFRWLTATRSTIVQVSKVHSGLCASAAETLQQLFETLVL